MDVGTGPNSSGYSINFTPVMWSLSGSWIGCRALCATRLRSWSSSGKPEDLRGEVGELRERMAHEISELRERMAKLEGLLEGLREAITGRVKAG